MFGSALAARRVLLSSSLGFLNHETTLEATVSDGDARTPVMAVAPFLVRSGNVRSPSDKELSVMKSDL